MSRRASATYYMLAVTIALSACSASPAHMQAMQSLGAGSACFGSTSNGRLQGGVQVTMQGANFEVIRLKDAPPRLFVHSTVKHVLNDALAAMAEAKPSVHLLIGETGLASGGPLSGHKTHQNGTSVDLFVPVVDAADGTPMPFTNDFRNGYGYKERFDAQGRSASRMKVDFEALGEYIYQLHAAAKKSGVGIQRIILIRDYQLRLRGSARGAYLSSNIRFVDDPADRHDNHMHVDFDLPCESPLAPVR